MSSIVNSEIKTTDFRQQVQSQNEFLIDILCGLSVPFVSLSYEQYKELHELRHELMLYVYLVSSGMSFTRKYRFKDFALQVLSVELPDEFSDIARLTPDILEVVEDVVVVGDLTLTTNPKMAEASKRDKYGPIFLFLQKYNFDYESRFIILDEHLETRPEMVDEKVFEIFTQINNRFRQCQTHVLKQQASADFESKRRKGTTQFTPMKFPEFKTKLSSPTISSTYEIDLYNLVLKRSSTDDHRLKFLDKDSALSELLEHLSKQHKKYLEKGGKNKLKPVVRYPHSHTSSLNAWRLAQDVDDPVLKFLFESGTSDKIGEHISPSIPKEIKRTIAHEGPGRKQLNLDHHMDENDEGFCIDYDPSIVDEIERLDKLWMTSNYTHSLSSDEDVVSEAMLKYMENTPLGKYLTQFQDLHREISLNCSRKEHKKSMIVCSAGSVFAVIAPGPKLRQDSVVWVKYYFSSEDDYKGDVFIKTTRLSQNLCCTRWISLDLARMDWYINIFARWSLVTASFIDAYGSSISSSLEKMRPLATVCALLLLEMKKVTSNWLMDLRYVVCGHNSARQNYSSISRFKETPNRSLLQNFFLRKLILYLQTEPEISNAQGTRVRHFRSVLTTERVSFQFLLNEIYLYVLCNKDLMDETHSLHKVYRKMLESEFIYKNMTTEEKHIVSEGVMLDGSDNKEWLLNNKTYHGFSAHFLVYASSIRLNDNANTATVEEIRNYLQSSNLNRSLLEFATMKSTALEKGDERTKCAVAAFDLLSHGIKTTEDVFSSHGEIRVQIFAKKQSGNPREIIILPLDWRVMINYVENISRKILLFDKRDFLTKGSEKVKTMQNIIDNQNRAMSSSKFSGMKSFQFFMSKDKSKWATRFFTTQFRHLFTNYLSPNEMRAIDYVLESCSSKKIAFATKLTDTWEKHPEFTYESPAMNFYKSKYLSDHKDFFINNTNMMQGIFHFTSTLLHVSVDSALKRLLELYCQQHKVYHLFHSLITSDDITSIFTANSEDASSLSKFVQFLFSACDVCDRLGTCHTSYEKSFFDAFLYEFNSCFSIKDENYSPLIKYASACANTSSTRSFAMYVQQSFDLVKPIYENGGSSWLCKMAQKLKMRDAEAIFKIKTLNNPELVYEVKEHLIPYQFGVYPDLPICLLPYGPIMHNIKIINRNTPMISKKLMSIAYTKVFKFSQEQLLRSQDEGLFITKLSSGIKYKNMMLKVGFTKEKLLGMLEVDPLLLERDSDDIEVQKAKIFSMLNSDSIADSLREYSQTHYFCRSTANVSSKIYKIPGVDGLSTFNECLLYYKELKSEVFPDVKDYIPYFTDYCTALESVPVIGSFKPTSLKQRLTYFRIFNKSDTAFRGYKKHLINVWTTGEQSALTARVFMMLKSFCPLLDVSLDKTLKAIGLERHEAHNLFVYFDRLFRDRSIYYKKYSRSVNQNDIKSTIKELMCSSSISYGRVDSTQMFVVPKDLALLKEFCNGMSVFLQICDKEDFERMKFENMNIYDYVEQNALHLNNSLLSSYEKSILLGLMTLNNKDLAYELEMSNLTHHKWVGSTIHVMIGSSSLRFDTKDVSRTLHFFNTSDTETAGKLTSRLKRVWSEIESKKGTTTLVMRGKKPHLVSSNQGNLYSLFYNKVASEASTRLSFYPTDNTRSVWQLEVVGSPPSKISRLKLFNNDVDLKHFQFPSMSKHPYSISFLMSKGYHHIGFRHQLTRGELEINFSDEPPVIQVEKFQRAALVYGVNCKLNITEIKAVEPEIKEEEPARLEVPEMSFENFEFEVPDWAAEGFILEDMVDVNVNEFDMDFESILKNIMFTEVEPEKPTIVKDSSFPITTLLDNNIFTSIYDLFFIQRPTNDQSISNLLDTMRMVHEGNILTKKEKKWLMASSIYMLEATVKTKTFSRMQGVNILSEIFLKNSKEVSSVFDAI